MMDDARRAVCTVRHFEDLVLLVLLYCRGEFEIWDAAAASAWRMEGFKYSGERRRPPVAQELPTEATSVPCMMPVYLS